MGELCVSTIFPSEKLAAQVLVCLSVGLKCWKFCWESCVYTVVCKYYLPCREICCPGTCVPIGWFEVLEVLGLTSVTIRYIQFCWESCVYTVVCEYYLPFREVGCPGTCVPIGWFEVLEVLLGELCVSTIFPSEKLAAQVLVCLSVGLKCWKFCWESCVYTVVCKYYLPCREVCCPGTCVPIGWFEVLEVLGLTSVTIRYIQFCWESCVYTVVCEYYLPFREVGCPCTCLPIGWFEVLEVLMGELCVSTIFPSEKLAAHVLVCLSVGLKCWKF